MKLALHRSLTFWSGLVVIGFICWSCFDSLKNVSSAVYDRFGAYQGAGGVTVCFASEAIWGQGLGRTYFPARAERSESGTINFIQIPSDAEVTPWVRPMFSTAGHEVTCFLPHWLLLLAVALIWSGLLIWRARRRNRDIQFGLNQATSEQCLR